MCNGNGTAMVYGIRSSSCFLFLRPMLRLQSRQVATSTLKGEVDANNSSLKDVRRLCEQGRLKEALRVFHRMKQSLDNSTYVSLLRGCTRKKSLSDGKRVLAHINERGFMPDKLLRNTIVNMYAKCGSLGDARIVFNQMPERDVFSWTVMIAAYAKQGFAKEASTLFHQMQRAGIQPNQFTFASVLSACADLEAVKDVHEKISRSGFQSDAFVGSALVDMYGKYGSIEDARNAFDKIPQRDLVLWNAMIAAYSRLEHSEEAFTLLSQMQRTGIQPDQYTFASVLPACAILAVLKDVHEQIIRSGFQSDVFLGSALVDMYAKCGSIENARHVFDKMPQRDVVSWNAMISAYASQGPSQEALKLFYQMQRTSIQPNQFTFASVLPACANLAALEQGMEIHKEIIRSGILCDIVVESAVLDMYAKCGNIENARMVFDRMPQRDDFSWNAIIAAYARHGFAEEALTLFHQMQRTSIQPNQFTFASVLPACADLAALEQGMEIHHEIIRNGFQSDVFLESALVDMYAKCGSIDKARDIFDKMHQRDVVSWTAMIVGFTQNGHAGKALKLFRQMQLADVKPDSKTFAGIIPACSILAALEQGMEIHEEVIKSGFQSDISVANALVDMYAKCGSIDKARNVFDKMHQRNTVSWTAMIAGYAMHGCGKEAIKLFEQMQQSGTNPNHVTLVCVLSACCHAGLVNEGLQYFDRMIQYYDITPAMEHYGCMVDLLCRAGRLDEAKDFMNKMPIEPDAAVWGCLLGACRIYNNIEIGECVAEHLFELDPQNATPYVLLSNIYAAAGRWEGIDKVRKIMKDRRVIKTPGCSWIKVNKKVHAFLVGDRSHPQTENLCKVGEII